MKKVYGREYFNKLDFNLLYSNTSLFEPNEVYELVGHRCKQINETDYQMVVIMRNIHTRQLQEHTPKYILDHYPDTTHNYLKRGED